LTPTLGTDRFRFVGNTADPTQGVRMDTTTATATAVMRGVRHHLFMVGAMDMDRPSDREYWGLASVALCILSELGAGNDLDGEETRGFLTDCGIPERIAAEMVSDDDPTAIY
jgi:hypothetical protein